MGDPPDTSSEDSKSSPFFGSSSSETDLLPNFFLRLDFTDRGALETTNKEKVDLFWKYIETKTSLSSLVVLSDEAVNQDESVFLEKQNDEKIPVKKSQHPWIEKLKEFERLGYKATASAAGKGCNGSKKDIEYTPQPSDLTLCLDLCKWDKEYRLKVLSDPPPHWIAYKKNRDS